jgi:hypothetical protein
MTEDNRAELVSSHWEDFDRAVDAALKEGKLVHAKWIVELHDISCAIRTPDAE